MSLPVFFVSPRCSRPAAAAVLYLVKVCAFLILVFMSLVFLFAARPAHAGSWIITYDYVTTNSSADATTSYPPYSVTYPNQKQHDDGQYFFSSPIGIRPISPAKTSIKTAMTITATLTWSASDPDDLPPFSVSVLEKAMALGGAQDDTSPVGSRQGLSGIVGSANDGLGDPSNTFTTPNPGQSSYGYHLYQFTNTARLTILRLPTRTLSASVFGPYPQPDSYYRQCWCGYRVDIDNRAVTISANVDATKYKKPVLDSTGRQLRNTDGDLVYEAYPHSRDADGTMKGDVSPGYGDPDYNADYSYFKVTYKANLLGNWAMKNSQYLWNSSYKNYSSNGVVTAPPPDDDVPLLTNKYRKPYLLYTDATTPPVHVLGDVTNSKSTDRMPDHIFFKYKNGDNRGTPLTTGNDGDGAVATANYYLTIHEPDEIFTSSKHGFLTPGPTNIENMVYYDLSPHPRTGTKDQLMSVSNGGFITSGFGATGTWNFPGAFWENASAVLGVSSNAPYPAKFSYAGLTLAALGLAVDKLGPKADSRPINLEQAAYDDPMSTFPANHRKGTEPITNYRLYPKVHIWFKRYYTLHDTYDMTGYIGEVLEYTDVFQSYGSVYGEFQSLADPTHG